MSYFDEIKAGDTVFVANHAWHISGNDVPVISVTATQIVTAGRRFRRKDGKTVGGNRYRDPFIATPERAADIRLEMRRREISLGVERVRFVMTPECVRMLRSYLDTAETFLREVGEWTEETAS